jgi:hypothetical protein
VPSSRAIALVRHPRVRENIRVGFATANLAERFDLLAVLLRLVVLLSILMKPMMSLDRWAFGHLGGLPVFLDLFHEPAMRLLSVLPFSVLLRARRALFSLSHRWSLS